MDALLGDTDVPFSLVVGTGVTTLVLAAALAYVLFQTNNKDGKDGKVPSAASSVSSSNEQQQSQELDKSKYPGGALYLYYATQTGTAESFCRQLEREGPKHGFLCHVVDLEDVTAVTALQTPCILLSATYGEGEPTDNATAFCDLLQEAASLPILFESTSLGKKKKATSSAADGDNNAEEAETKAEPQQLLPKVEYCVFGLGNRQYDHYNAMGKFFNEALSRCGAQRILPIGLGDDDADLEGDFETWKDGQLWPKLKELYLPQDGTVSSKMMVEGVSEAFPSSPYVVEYHDKNDKQKATQWDLPMDQVHGASRHYFDAVELSVTAIRELRSEKDPGSTMHLELSATAAAASSSFSKKTPPTPTTTLLNYQTADNLGVLPVNDVQHVESVATSLGYDLDAVFSVRAAPDAEWHGAPFPMPLSIRTLLTHYCDLTSAPRRSELKLLSKYATDKVDQQFLQRLSAKASYEEYKTKILNDYLGLVHILTKCPSIQLPLEHFLDVCPRLQPRFFTIASSSGVHPQSIHLTVAVAQAMRPSDQSTFHGVCSTYLAQRQANRSQKQQGGLQIRLPFGNKNDKQSKEGDTAGNNNMSTIRAFVRPSSFRLPADASKPIILIGPGTGVAPMRALLQERQRLKKAGKAVGKNIMYFGCKQKEQDYLYRDEMQAWQQDGTLHDLRVAFSRAQTDKVYVQHLLLQNAQETCDLVDQQGAYIYVCGGVKMGHDVQEALKTILKQQLFFVAANDDTETVQQQDKAKDYVDQLAKDGRYVQELWA